MSKRGAPTVPIDKERLAELKSLTGYITDVSLANAIGITNRAIWKIRKEGSTKPQTRQKLCNLVGWLPSYLSGESDIKTNNDLLISEDEIDRIHKERMINYLSEVGYLFEPAYFAVLSSGEISEYWPDFKEELKNAFTEDSYKHALLHTDNTLPFFDYDTDWYFELKPGAIDSIRLNNEIITVESSGKKLNIPCELRFNIYHDNKKIKDVDLSYFNTLCDKIKDLSVAFLDGLFDEKLK